MRRKERRVRTDWSTLFSSSVEDSHILQIHTQTTPHGQGLAGVSLEATANRTIRVRPETVNSHFRMCIWLSSSLLQLSFAHFGTEQHMDLCCSSLLWAQNKYYGSLNWQFWGQRNIWCHITVATVFTELQSMEFRGGVRHFSHSLPIWLPSKHKKSGTVHHNIRTCFHKRLDLIS